MCCREMSTETYVETIIFSAEVNSLDSQLTHLYLQDHQKCDTHELTLHPVDLPHRCQLNCRAGRAGGLTKESTKKVKAPHPRHRSLCLWIFLCFPQCCVQETTGDPGVQAYISGGFVKLCGPKKSSGSIIFPT